MHERKLLPLKAETGVRFPVGAPAKSKIIDFAEQFSANCTTAPILDRTWAPRATYFALPANRAASRILAYPRQKLSIAASQLFARERTPRKRRPPSSVDPLFQQHGSAIEHLANGPLARPVYTRGDQRRQRQAVAIRSRRFGKTGYPQTQVRRSSATECCP